jgi:hypothetical protein
MQEILTQEGFWVKSEDLEKNKEALFEIVQNGTIDHISMEIERNTPVVNKPIYRFSARSKPMKDVPLGDPRRDVRYELSGNLASVVRNIQSQFGCAGIQVVRIQLSFITIMILL